MYLPTSIQSFDRCPRVVVFDCAIDKIKCCTYDVVYKVKSVPNEWSREWYSHGERTPEAQKPTHPLTHRGEPSRRMLLYRNPLKRWM